jgi:hypothetical protein
MNLSRRTFKSNNMIVNRSRRQRPSQNEANQGLADKRWKAAGTWHLLARHLPKYSNYGEEENEPWNEDTILGDASWMLMEVSLLKWKKTLLLLRADGI